MKKRLGVLATGGDASYTGYTGYTSRPKAGLAGIASRELGETAVLTTLHELIEMTDERRNSESALMCSRQSVVVPAVPASLITGGPMNR